jgi:hypothetical protein
MTTTVKRLLDTFDALPDPEKHQAAVEILKRAQAQAPADLPDAALVEAADELFQGLDTAEAGRDQP